MKDQIKCVKVLGTIVMILFYFTIRNLVSIAQHGIIVIKLPLTVINYINCCANGNNFLNNLAQ